MPAFATGYAHLVEKYTINTTTKRTVKVELHTALGEDEWSGLPRNPDHRWEILCYR
jgi:hypothetical protein